MGKGNAPTPPDPKQTAAAQTASNKDTAIAQANLNHVNQTDANGNTLTYTQIGTNADGTPKYQQTTTLSPQQQALQNTNNATQQSLATTASTQAGRLNDILSQPLDLSNDATEARLMELGRKRLDPILAQQRDATETDLINRGIRPGSDNYAQAHTLEDQKSNDAYNQLLLSGHSQAVSDALAARNQPLNEIIGLASGTQLQNPQFASTPQVGVAGTDTAGITQNAYNQQSQQYQQGQSDLYGGLFGLGKAALGMFSFSDERLKKDIRSTGRKIKGVDEKTWTWRGTTEKGRGVIAQELERVHPEMVVRDPDTNFRQVNYGALMSGAVT